MSDLSSLIARLEKAEGPDREIDALIWLKTTDGATRKALEVKSATNLWPPYTIDETRDETGRLIIVPPVTSSIDAAVSLAERVLPGWLWSITFGLERSAAFIRDMDIFACDPIEGKGYHRTPAIALVLATLRALQQKGYSNG